MYLKISIVIFGLIIIAAIIIPQFVGHPPMPTDEELIAVFKNNKSTFEQLLGFSERCNGYGISNRSQTNDKTCSTLANKIGVRFVLVREKFVQFTASRSTSIFARKGYVHSNIELSPLFNSLNNLPEEVTPYSNGYRKLEDGWYLYIENSSD